MSENKKGLAENLTIVIALFTLIMLLYFSVHTFLFSRLGYSDIPFTNSHNLFVSLNKKIRLHGQTCTKMTNGLHPHPGCYRLQRSLIKTVAMRAGAMYVQYTT